MSRMDPGRPSPEAGSWSGEYFNPDDYAKYEDMTPDRLRMLEPPNARYRGRPMADSLTASL